MSIDPAIDPATIDFQSAVPPLDGELHLSGIGDTVTIQRDAYGIAHIAAASESDAWFGQGYAAAQDRLWQMEGDRRRALGRWAEAVGPDARFAGSRSVAADILARRLRLADAAQADWEAMSPETRAMFEAYAGGVNAFIESGNPLPIEYGICGITAEPWEPWHSIALFKVRHVLMGLWQQKITSAELLLRVGPEGYQRLDTGSPPGSAVILPPGARVAELTREAAADIRAAAETLGFLAEVEAGSNSWAVHGSRTTTGKPIVCNDSHRALDVPSVYWQVHVSSPGFDVSGATFPGFPAFPHFGFNGHVAWNITHTQGDYQDLYIERFDSGDPPRYESPGGPRAPDYRRERILVRGADPVDIETWATGHGPIVHGDPRSGFALALRYTATDRACTAWECLRPMLGATTVAELHETQRTWVDPVNSLVSADTSGNIGFLCRGRLPIRASTLGRHLPVPGWTGEHEWTGDVPFEQMPQSINPPEGFIATANQRVIDGDEPYISDSFATPGRADRLAELLGNSDTLTPDAIAAMQGDTTSVYARAWAHHLRRFGPFDGDAERARALLAGWDGNLLPGSAAALLYAYFRRYVTRSIVSGALGHETWDWLSSEASPSYARVLGQWLANTAAGLPGPLADTSPTGQPWASVLPDILADAWASAVESAGPDPAVWRWDAEHTTRPRHALGYTAPGLSEALDPPRAAIGGDADTLQCAGYGWSGKADFAVTLLSVYRQAVDFAEPASANYIVPGGVSGQPGTPHYADQLEHWRKHERIPMRPDAANMTHRLTLRPKR